MSRRREIPKRMRPDDGSGGVPWGEIAAIAGVILAAVAGILVAGLGVFFIDFVLELFGIALGAMGYALSARRLGIAAVVFSTVLLFVFLAVS